MSLDGLEECGDPALSLRSARKMGSFAPHGEMDALFPWRFLGLIQDADGNTSSNRMFFSQRKSITLAQRFDGDVVAIDIFSGARILRVDGRWI